MQQSTFKEEEKKRKKLNEYIGIFFRYVVHEQQIWLNFNCTQLFVFTVAAGLPPIDMQSNSMSLFSFVSMKSPCIIRGGSGGTKTSILANCERIPGSSCGPGETWLVLLNSKENVYFK